MKKFLYLSHAHTSAPRSRCHQFGLFVFRNFFNESPLIGTEYYLNYDVYRTAKFPDDHSIQLFSTARRASTSLFERTIETCPPRTSSQVIFFPGQAFLSNSDTIFLYVCLGNSTRVVRKNSVLSAFVQGNTSDLWLTSKHLLTRPSMSARVPRKSPCSMFVFHRYFRPIYIQTY